MESIRQQVVSIHTATFSPGVHLRGQARVIVSLNPIQQPDVAVDLGNTIINNILDRGHPFNLVIPVQV